MADLAVRLFGSLQIERDGRMVGGLAGGRAQELLGWLLLHPDRRQAREQVAETLWGDGTGAPPKKTLRHAIWQLHSTLDAGKESEAVSLLDVQPDWITLNSGAVWLDVVQFELAFAGVEGTAGRDLTSETAAALRAAVLLYRGDLMEGCYQDWCLFERERLQNRYIRMLDKLMSHAEIAGEYEAGVGYGLRILRLDRAHERTHRQLMRLHALAGDRTTALRQFDACAAALREEMAVEPARGTTALRDQIRADLLRPPIPAARETTPDRDALLGALQRLRSFGFRLAELELQLQHDLEVVELSMHRHQ